MVKVYVRLPSPNTSFRNRYMGDLIEIPSVNYAPEPSFTAMTKIKLISVLIINNKKSDGQYFVPFVPKKI